MTRRLSVCQKSRDHRYSSYNLGRFQLNVAGRAMIDTEHGSLIGNLIFLSYRRSDSAAHTLALRLELETQLRAAQIFVDTHAVQGGETWPVQIEDALYLAKVVIPIIGKSWAGVDSAGRRRIDDPEDWV